MTEMKDWLFRLSDADGAGYVDEAARLAAEILSRYTKVETGNGLTVMGRLSGKRDHTVLIDAHLDQVAMLVTDIDEEGFLTVAKAGGIDLRALPARPVTVHGKEKISAVFCSTPPHLSTGEREFSDLSEIKLDTGLSGKARELVSVGDIVTFSAKPIALAGDKISGRSFDDRAGVVCVLELARRLSEKALPVNVCFVLSDGEELGLRGIRPAAYTAKPDEAIAIDVTFGDGPGISEEESGKLGQGPMIGFSPSLTSAMSQRLVAIAKENEIPYQIEVMGDTTGTNADMLSVSRGGVKTCTVSIPLRNMHTDTEVLSLSDLENTVCLIEEYLLSGGIAHA